MIQNQNEVRTTFLSLLRKYPAAVSAVPLMLGILLGYLIHFNEGFINSIILISLQLLILTGIVFVYTKAHFSSYKTFIVFIILVLIFGLVRFQYFYKYTSADNISNYSDRLKDKNVLLFGTLIERPDEGENSVRFIISADSLVVNDKSISVSGNVIASIYKSRSSDSFLKWIQYGDKLSIKGNLTHLPHRRNPGEFDYGEYLKLHGIDAQFTAFGYNNIGLTGRTDPNFFKKYVIYPVKAYSLMVLDSLIGGDEGEFMKGLVLGERSNISNEIKQNFVKAGVSHIIAVSGLNVAYVLIIINGLLLLFPLKRHYKVFIAVICLIFYMYLTGNVPSIVRATVMACVFLFAQLLERKPLSYNMVAFSSLVILVVDPMQLFDAGFILSYSAILSLVIFYPRLISIFSHSQFYKALNSESYTLKAVRAVIMLVLGTIAAQIGTLPVTAMMFKKISIVSLFTNLVAIPVSNIALAIGFIMIIVSTFSYWLAGAFAISASFILSLLLRFIDYFANLKFAFAEIYSADTAVLFFYYVIVFLLFSIKKKNYIPRLSLILLLIINFITFKSLYDKDNNVKLAYLDVGNSSSCLISSPDKNYNFLVNAGTSSVKYTTAERNLIPYFKSRGADHIDQLFITSLNKDEFRNLVFLLNNFKVKKLILPVYYRSLFSDTSFENYFQNCEIEYIENSKMINDNSDFRVYIYYLNDDLPSASMLVKVKYKNEDFIFSDSKNMNEDYFYASEMGSCRILKVPASGSFNYTSPEFILSSAPTYAVISTSKNSKRVNSEIFCRTLEHSGIKVVKVAETGAALFETDGYKTGLVDWK